MGIKKFVSNIFEIPGLKHVKWMIKIMLRKQNPFDSTELSAAKKVILTSWGPAITSEYRWQVETGYELVELRKYIKDNSVICDFGIGIGRVSKEILREFPNVHIVGIDSSEAMLNNCRKNIPSIYHNRLRLVLFSKIGTIETKSIDFIICIYVLQHISAKLFETTLKELYRIIKPNGYLYLLNSKKRFVVDGGLRKQWYDDNLPQLEIFLQYFEEIQDVIYESEYMKKVTKSHYSKIFRPKIFI